MASLALIIAKIHVLENRQKDGHGSIGCQCKYLRQVSLPFFGMEIVNAIFFIFRLSSALIPTIIVYFNIYNNI